MLASIVHAAATKLVMECSSRRDNTARRTDQQPAVIAISNVMTISLLLKSVNVVTSPIDFPDDFPTSPKIGAVSSLRLPPPIIYSGGERE